MPAPVGNKFALGMGGGRPPVFENNDALIARITEFFDWVKGESHTEKRTIAKKDKVTKEVIEEEVDVDIWDRMPEQPNITNLALFLGFDSRQSFYDYGKNEEFSYTIKRARLAIENHYEGHLLTPAAPGAIFALKNFGWTDKQEIEHTDKDGKDLIPAALDRLSTEELNQLQKIQRQLKPD